MYVINLSTVWWLWNQYVHCVRTLLRSWGLSSLLELLTCSLTSPTDCGVRAYTDDLVWTLLFIYFSSCQRDDCHVIQARRMDTFLIWISLSSGVWSVCMQRVEKDDADSLCQEFDGHPRIRLRELHRTPDRLLDTIDSKLSSIWVRRRGDPVV